MSANRPVLSRDSLYPILVGLVALTIFLPGIGWGLPSREDDRFLFGGRTPWTGQQIIELAGDLDAESGRGTDVDANPIAPSGEPIVLNETDQKRAEIVRRYRLMSHQPDEFINFKAIGEMARRRDADPRLYQYGGLWIYPLGGLLGAAHVAGLVELRGDMAFYLDRPEEFGKFYIVARLYSALWGAIGAGVVFVIVRRLTGDRFISFCAGLSFALLPVIVTAAHEAKPHLAGAVLVILAVVKADDYVRTGRRRDAIYSGMLCGAAGAMVISMLVSFVLLPVMGHLRWRRSVVGSRPQVDAVESDRDQALGRHDLTRSQGLLSTSLSLLMGFGLYALTNPYAIYHALFDRAVFASNISNSTAMYQARDLLGGTIDGLALMVIAAGTLFAVALVTAIVVFVVRRSRPGARAWLLITAAGAVLIYYLPLGAGKPPEYARFGIVPMTVLVVAYFAVVGRGLFPLPRQKQWLAVTGLVLATIAGVPYIANFVDDSGQRDTRLRAAEQIRRLAQESDVRALALGREPAPWSVPPFDLWEFKAVLGPTDAPRQHIQARVLETAYMQRPLSAIVFGRYVTPISWANKPVFVWDRPDHNDSGRGDQAGPGPSSGSGSSPASGTSP